MRRCSRLSWTVTLCVCGLTVFGRPAMAQEPYAATAIKWRHDYNSARMESQQKNLLLLIDFGTQNCFWCRKLDDTTFREPRIIAVMNEKFLPLKIDAGREASLASALGISSYPTLVVASPDGKVLGTMEGYQNADKLHENLQRAVAAATPPDWMQRDLHLAQKWMQTGDYPRAITVLKTIIEDGRARPVQETAEKLLGAIEQRAAERLVRGKQLHAAGKHGEAIETLGDAIRTFPGLRTSREATDLMARIIQDPEVRSRERGRRAGELLAQAREFYKNKEYIPCLDRCEILVGNYGDLPEGQDGAVLVSEIKSNPEWLQSAADTMTDRLGSVYLALADALLKKGQTQRAEQCLQRVIQAFPGSRQAESAQIRLGQLQGVPSRNAAVRSAGP